jgi:hypothetical protein
MDWSVLNIRRTKSAAAGTVASRIQALQAAQNVNKSPVEFHKPFPRSTSPAESDFKSRQGKTADSTVGTSASTAIHERNEAVKSDVEPPMGTPGHRQQPSMEKEVYVPTQTKLDQGPQDVISHARAKLRSVKKITEASAPIQLANASEVNEVFEPRAVKPHERGQNVIEELGDMLESAIEETKSVTVEQLDNSSPVKPQDNPLQRTQSLSSIIPPSTIDCRPRSNSSDQNAPKIIYSLPEDTVSPRSEYTDTTYLPHSSSESDHIIKEQEEPVQSLIERSATHLAVFGSTQKGPSPVKERAAMFEKLAQDDVRPVVCEAPHPARKELDPISSTHSHFPPVRGLSPSKVMHKPPIPLALPQILSKRDLIEQLDRDAVDFITAPQTRSASRLASRFPTQLPDAQPSYTRERAPVSNWPFKSNLFPPGKARPAWPIKSPVEAATDPEHDAHLPQQSLGQIREIIQKTVLPAHSGEHRGVAEEQCSGDVPTQQQATAVNGEVIHDKLDPKQKQEFDSSTKGYPRSQMHTPKKLKSTEPKRSDEAVPLSLSRTPTKPEAHLTRPRKTDSSPGNPFRGRPRAHRASTSEIVQRYSLSRSRSRGGVKIQLEVRTPQGSPSVANDDHIVTIRANVEPLEED